MGNHYQGVKAALVVINAIIHHILKFLSIYIIGGDHEL